MFAQHFTNLGHLHRFFKLQVHDAAAGKINSQIEPAENHGAVPDHQTDDRNRKENFPVPYNRKVFHFATSSAFGVEMPKAVGLLVKLASMRNFSKNLVTVTAENILKITPMDSVTANPLMGPVPK